VQLRAQLGLPPRASPIFEGQFSPALVLALFSPIFGPPQPDWPPNTVITGFPFYREAAALPPELRDFFAAGPPPVVFTLGSSASATPGTFFEQSRRCLIQSANRDFRDLLASRGHPRNLFYQCDGIARIDAAAQCAGRDECVIIHQQKNRRFGFFRLSRSLYLEASFEPLRSATIIRSYPASSSRNSAAWVASNVRGISVRHELAREKRIP
jgi:hypothetical protein